MTGHLREARGHRHLGGSLGISRPCGLADEHARHLSVAAIIAIVGTVIAAAGTGYSIYAASEAQADQADYQKKVARNQAEAAKQSTVIAEENQREQDRRVMSAQRARAAGAGIDEDFGSSLLAAMENAETAALNQRRIHWAGETQSRGYEAEAIKQGWAAGSYRRAGYVGGGTSLLAGATSAAGIAASSYGRSGYAANRPPDAYGFGR